MTILLSLIWALLGIFLILSVLALLMPVSISGQADLNETARLEIAMTWAGGLASLHATASGDQPLVMNLHLGHRVKQLQLHASYISWLISVRSRLDRAVLKEVFRYLLRLNHYLELKLRFEGEIGLGDPDLTAYLAGLLTTLNTSQWQCDLYPNFTETVLHFQGMVQGRAKPARVLWLTSCLLFSPPVRNLWWPKWRDRTPK